MILPITQGARFFKLFDMVTIYAHSRLHVVGDDEFYSQDEPRGIGEAAQRDTCEELWKQPSLLGDFVQENPFGLPPRDLAIVDSWQSCFMSTFVVEPLPQSTTGEIAFTYGNHTFVVSGLAVPIDSMITAFPAIVHTTLLPYEDKIVYAMFMAQMPVDMGDTMRNQTHKELVQNIAEGRVMRTGAELVATVPIIREEELQRGLKDLRHDIQMEERAAGPLPGQHRSVLAGMGRDERERAIKDHLYKTIRQDKDDVSLSRVFIERCHESEPVFSLDELLALPNNDGRVYEDGDEQYWRDLAKPECLQSDLMCAEEEQIKHLHELANRGGRWRITASEVEGITSLRDYPFPLQGLCYYFRDGEDCLAVMPNEVVAASHDVDWDEAIAYAHNRRDMLRFFETLTDLRGVVPLPDAVLQYCVAYPNGFKNPQEIVDIVVESLDSIDFGCYLLATSDEDYLMHYEVGLEYLRCEGRNTREEGSYLEGEPNKVITWLWDQQRGKEPRPVTSEMLEYESVWLWAMEQPPALAMRDFLDAHVPDESDDYFFADKVIEDLITEVFWGQTDGGVQVFFDILDENGFYPDESQLQELLNLWTGMCNGLPCWPNNGWAPNELASRRGGRRLFYNADGSIMKVGRNDPCPCGSGKKYKRCCGR